MIPYIFLSFFKSRFSVNSFLPVKDLHFKTLFFFISPKKNEELFKGIEKEKLQAQKRKGGKKILFAYLYFLFYSRSLCF
jgi:hypothetical protein